jgi:ribosome biogenesis GTPase / thiamine phosphate phosphatase
MKKEGIVVKIFGAYYTVLYDSREITCTLRGKFRARNAKSNYTDPVAVGDRVYITCTADGAGTIDEILPRKNVFSRKEKGRVRNEDIIASNLDTIVVVLAFHKPRLNLRFADRILVRAQKENIRCIVCINKTDLADEDDMNGVCEYYQGSGVALLFASALTGRGMDELLSTVREGVSLFVGISGVGKSSILNYLMPSLNLKTIEISDKTGKGRHATTNVQMIGYDEHGSIIDTPGLREFGLTDIPPPLLGNYFMEFGRYSGECSFRPCTHDHEPRCGIKRRVEEGSICEDRYISYLNILYSLKEYEDTKYP